MKIQLKWSKLGNAQLAQIRRFFEEELKNKHLYEHELNSRMYSINPYTGDVIFNKDF